MIAAMAVLLVLGGASQTQGTTFVFATVEEGKKILTARDEFVQALSPFDRAARVKTDKDVSEEAFLAFVGQSVLDWTDAEKKQMAAALDVVKEGLGRYPLPLPKTVYLVKTTGQEEGNAAYTRDNAIVLPKSDVAPGRPSNPRVLYHELFHILSRANPDLRERLYKAIGFEKCSEVTFPESLKSHKITNPDGPRNDHSITVQVAGESVWVVPVLFSQVERYDPNRGGEFFNYMQCRFLEVARDANSPAIKPRPAGEEPRMISQNRMSGFFEQIGRNTQYTIHPDEILADNFASLMMQDRNVRSPEILKKMETILSGKPPARTPAGGN
jgi:hypothetical protein